ncbi:hypothetical protein BJY00DRAFT_150772 [Aspergillus carlsbadensis]|nr:hypothetical protein BJY00DRAFT_150772 [Aspergillus carlsbadensis]
MSTLSGYPVESCMSCRSKKRKCDKKLPACSRCKQVGGQCLYGSWSYGVYGRVVPVPELEMLKLRSDPRTSPLVLASSPKHIPKACSVCQKHKKFCDRSYPCCGRCKRVKATCTYEGMDRVRLLKSQHYFSPDMPLHAVEYKPDYPVETKPNFQELIKFFQYRIALQCLEVDQDSLASHLQTSWLGFAASDPCLFHATLYLASAQLDRFRGQLTPTDGSITVYHHMRAIQLLNPRIAAGAEPDDTTIAAVVLLALSGCFERNDGAAQAHGKGLLRMVEMRGGLDSLGFRGFLAQLIHMNTVFPATVFDRLDAFPDRGWDTSSPPFGFPRLALDRLRNRPSRKSSPAVRSHLINMFERVYDLLLAVDGIDDITMAPEHFLHDLHNTLNDHWSPPTSYPSDITKSERALLRSCVGTVQILQYLLDTRVPFDATELARLRTQLKADLEQTDPPTWVRYTAEANLWVMNIGMAMCDAVEGRMSFLLDKQCIVMSIRAIDTALHEKFWCCYSWFRGLLRRRMKCGGWQLC